MSRLQDRKGARDEIAGLRASGAGARVQVTAALDLGASKVGCFIMKPDGLCRTDRTVRVAGVGYVQSRGVKAGAIVDVEAAGDAIAQAVERAEQMAGVAVSGVTISTAAGQIASGVVSAQVSLGARPITDADLT